MSVLINEKTTVHKQAQFLRCEFTAMLSPVSIQTQSLALRALRKRKPQETQALALASSQSWLPLLRPSIPIGWRLRLLRGVLILRSFEVYKIFSGKYDG